MGRLSLAAATTLAVKAFVAAGVPPKQAEAAAEILVLAEAMGITTHGLGRVTDYIGRIRAGGIDPTACGAVTRLLPALCRVDGANGLGPAVMQSALTEAITSASSCGVGAVFVGGSGHVGALAPYLYLAAEAGFAAFVTTTTAPMIAPAGGRSARIGNNPLGLAIPDPDGDHVLLDMALSVVSRSRVRAAQKAGQSIPETWASDANGHPTTDPAQALEGLMLAIGGDKGANLALCLDLMASTLSGSAMLSEIPNAANNPGEPQNLGQMLMLVNADALTEPEERSTRLANARRLIETTVPIDPDKPARLPGSRVLARLRSAMDQGMEFPQGLIDDIEALAGAG